MRHKLKRFLLGLFFFATLVGLLFYQDPHALFLLKIPAPVESYFCKNEAIRYLENSGINLPFQRCEQEVFHASNVNRSIKRMFLVAGKVQRGWEFECGFHIACQKHVFWLDEHNQPIRFIDPPNSPLADYAVKSTGCVPHGTVEFDATTQPPTLVFENGEFWWERRYDKTPAGACIISGRSLTSAHRVISAIRIDEILDDENAHTVKLQKAAILSGNPEKCSWIVKRRRGKKTKKKKLPKRIWDEECLWNYVLATGERSLCQRNYNLLGMDDLSCDVILKQELEILP